MNGEFEESELTRLIIGAFFATYNKLGYGFLESVYAEALERELRKLGLKVAREVSVFVWYDGEPIARQRLDFLVEDRVILELKSTAALAPAFSRIVFNYLRATRLRVGLLLHFGPKPHVHRVFCDT